MKLRFYLDLYPGQNTQYGLYASTNPPMPKGAIVTRVAFDVVIPEDLIYVPDRILVEVGKPEIVKDVDSGS